MRHGFSLLELLLVITLLGLLSLVAIPSALGMRDRLAVDAAARVLVEAFTRARLVAATEHRVTHLAISSDVLVLSARLSPTESSERWRHSGPGTYGIAVTGLPRQLLLAPSGIPYGLANHTYTLTKGSARRQVIVSRYGRVQLR